jgi:hypothetical protein
MAAPVVMTDLGVGDEIVVTAQTACFLEGRRTVFADSEGDLFVWCAHGRHYLETLQGEGGVLSGVGRALAS